MVSSMLINKEYIGVIGKLLWGEIGYLSCSENSDLIVLSNLTSANRSQIFLNRV